MFVEEIDNELKKVAEFDHAFNVPNKMDLAMINDVLYVVTDRMFDYDSGNVDCLVVKSENIKKNNSHSDTESIED